MALGAGDRRQKQGGKYRDDRDNHQQFHQRKAGSTV
jgi:hypothetical protein